MTIEPPPQPPPPRSQSPTTPQCDGNEDHHDQMDKGRRRGHNEQNGELEREEEERGPRTLMGDDLFPGDDMEEEEEEYPPLPPVPSPGSSSPAASLKSPPPTTPRKKKPPPPHNLIPLLPPPPSDTGMGQPSVADVIGRKAKASSRASQSPRSSGGVSNELALVSLDNGHDRGDTGGGGGGVARRVNFADEGVADAADDDGGTRAVDDGDFDAATANDDEEEDEEEEDLYGVTAADGDDDDDEDEDALLNDPPFRKRAAVSPRIVDDDEDDSASPQPIIRLPAPPPPTPPPPQKPAGRTGLGNLGNTCFMNSTLQCLAHTSRLRHHFASGRYRADLNADNPLGTGGELATEFAGLMRQMWGTPRAVVSADGGGADGGDGVVEESVYHTTRHSPGDRSYVYTPTSSVVYPRTFKYTLGRHASQFVGYDQHDSQELATYLLDALHEDTNLVRTKPYVEKPEQAEGESDALASRKAWDLHLRRDDSRVLNTFMGQGKSKVTCPTVGCGRVSTTFDPFMYLSVPVPGATDRTIGVTFVPLDPARSARVVRVTLPKTATVGGLVDRLAVILAGGPGADPSNGNNHNGDNGNNGSGTKKVDVADLCLVDVWSNEIFAYHQSGDEVSKIRDTDETYCYELTSVDSIHGAAGRASQSYGTVVGDGLGDGLGDDEEGEESAEEGGRIGRRGGGSKSPPPPSGSPERKTARQDRYRLDTFDQSSSSFSSSQQFKLDVVTEIRLNGNDRWMGCLERYTKPTLLASLLNTRRSTHAERMEFCHKLDAFVARCKSCPDALEEDEDAEGGQRGGGFSPADSPADSSSADASPSPTAEENGTATAAPLSLSEVSATSSTFRNVEDRQDLLKLDFCAKKFRRHILKMQRERNAQYKDGVVVQVLFKRDPSGGGGVGGAPSSPRGAASYHSPLHYGTSSAGTGGIGGGSTTGGGGAGDKSFTAPLVMRISPRLTVHGLRKLVGRRLARCLGRAGMGSEGDGGSSGELRRQASIGKGSGGFDVEGEEEGGEEWQNGDADMGGGVGDGGFRSDVFDSYDAAPPSRQRQKQKRRSGGGHGPAENGDGGRPRSAPSSAPPPPPSEGDVVQRRRHPGQQRDPLLFLMERIPLTFQRKGSSGAGGAGGASSYYGSTSSSHSYSSRQLGSLETSSRGGRVAHHEDEGETDLVAERVGRNGIISFHWPYRLANECFDSDAWETPSPEPADDDDVDDGVNGGKKKKKPLSVLDCVARYCQMEQLEESEMWYCNRCKEHVRAWKQMHIYRAPPVLILHLKRFQFSPTTHRRDKIDVHIDFPLVGLDLRKYVLHWEDGEEPVYDCYAVSNHYGGLGGGHYTAYAKNHGTWCHFDDSLVTTEGVRDEDVVSRAAYVLYYRRRDVLDDDVDVPMPSPHSSSVVDGGRNAANVVDEVEPMEEEEGGRDGDVDVGVEGDDDGDAESTTPVLSVDGSDRRLDGDGEDDHDLLSMDDGSLHGDLENRGYRIDVEVVGGVKHDVDEDDDASSRDSMQVDADTDGGEDRDALISQVL